MADSPTTPSAARGGGRQPLETESCNTSAPHQTTVLQSEDQRRWHGCLRKQAFRSVGNAHTAGRHQGMARGTFTAYQCRYCDQWHIAKKGFANG